MKTEDQELAAGHSIGPALWQDMFEILMGRIAGRFARKEPRPLTFSMADNAAAPH
ncbi:hypothetical protein ACFCZT_42945 [Streptomyces sp. NPDC056230]|uniref:hypothetical protein n=1 Tax=Streptomyces sp. NPDC056230 TaxID=3345754 RepID=UPI0035D87AF2